MTRPLIASLRGGFIVSCQALENEPLHGPEMMAAMASAAEAGGASAIRANTPQDIAFIKKKCKVPVIGLYKKHYPDSDVYITPTLREVSEVVRAGADIVAIDSTAMARPGNEKLERLIAGVKENFPDTPIMADISTFDEGLEAMKLGADVVSTTMSGYTPYSPQLAGPDFELIGKLAALGRAPVFAEGRIWTVEECLRCYEAGAHAVVIGTAITRPQEIVRRFVTRLKVKAQS
ncbi:N-acetylmannosamine-6-phosphate 2-epimerase [Paenibacillus arenilitoris]|uniref:Putative N-acetylmannosamine-6-phosphate 2-epimerase n=1 Tax=Paenibacillus arenilitoris TaxID=2772299 RepID=A0A927CLD3_9BACL|nr:N-acetylmannosamine-6-phosphate 2-epimerase [Paenibacillus arenilitoris]MBD2870179.1 N-acetylmannosamine-6-phosphate 2-epimerase [Paenibacillus arenilitoris]